jgi:tRNA pseudouridine55 synthase
MMRDFYKGEILLINKPLGWTSFQAVNKLKHGLKKHPSLLLDGKFVHLKIGHAGTLDPLATGLLIVCTGKKTKVIQTFQDQEKEYTGTFFIGATTPCYDLEKPIDKTYPTDHITDEKILEAASTFVGEQQQTPPLFSAVLVNGERAYDIARKGETVELKARTIEIKIFEITRIQMPEVDFRIVCSKGTYIRSIARDIGERLNTGAHLIKLCRTRIGEFKVGNALEPEEFLKQIQG